METPSHLLVTLVTPCKDPRFARVKQTASGLVHNLHVQVSYTLYVILFDNNDSSSNLFLCDRFPFVEDIVKIRQYFLANIS